MAECGLLIVVSGPSGVGKGAILNRIVEQDPNVIYSVSVTTRAARPGETEGVNYYYRSQDEFRAMVDSGEILEWDEFCGNSYGTPRTQLRNSIEQGLDVVLDLTVPGAKAVKEAFTEDAVSIFILPPTIDSLKERIRSRMGETEEQLEQRVSFAVEWELYQVKNFDYVVVNDVLEEAIREVKAIIEAERLRYRRNQGILKTQLGLE